MFESIASEHADVAIPARTATYIQSCINRSINVLSGRVSPQSAACSTADTDAAEVTRAATVLTAPGH